MKQMGLTTIVLGLLTWSTVASASSPGYELTLTNGGMMPISPPVFWISKNHGGVPNVGELSSQGQRNICESGNSAAFLKELGANRSVRWVSSASAPLFPGSSLKVQIPNLKVNHGESLYVTFMYGKSRNICGGLFNLDLKSLAIQVSNEITGRDSVFTSGAYSLPRASNNPSCAGVTNAVDCLRSMTSPLIGDSANRISNFSGYLPSVLTSIEAIYGADEAETLIVPSSGSINYKIERGN